MSSIFAGKNDESGNRDGAEVNARFTWAYGIAIDQQTSSLFVSDNITEKSHHKVNHFLSPLSFEYFDQEKCQQLLELETLDLQMVL
jgi:hypothetical protein